jgi:hypothetical protein
MPLSLSKDGQKIDWSEEVAPFGEIVGTEWSIPAPDLVF